jgi:hypothetical protein
MAMPLWAAKYDELTQKAPFLTHPFQNNTFNGLSFVEVDEIHCEKKEEFRLMLRHRDQSPNPEEILDNYWKYSSACSVEVLNNKEYGIVGFTLTNKTVNKINQKPNGIDSKRQYHFVFEERTKDMVRLEITDDSALTDRMSHDFLHTNLWFLPRLHLPFIAPETYHSKKVILNNGELIEFDPYSNEIIDGVLTEAPMDFTPSRHTRNFAIVTYTGKGLMIRTDRRSGTPDHIYSVSYNRNEKIKHARVFHGKKECLVTKEALFANANNADVGAYLKYRDDQELLDKVINPTCGWNLRVSDLY